jgi:hypothetical protein
LRIRKFEKFENKYITCLLGSPFSPAKPLRCPGEGRCQRQRDEAVFCISPLERGVRSLRVSRGVLSPSAAIVRTIPIRFSLLPCKAFALSGRREMPKAEG